MINLIFNNYILTIMIFMISYFIHHLVQKEKCTSACFHKEQQSENWFVSVQNVFQDWCSYLDFEIEMPDKNHVPKFTEYKLKTNTSSLLSWFLINVNYFLAEKNYLIAWILRKFIWGTWCNRMMVICISKTIPIQFECQTNIR